MAKTAKEMVELTGSIRDDDDIFEGIMKHVGLKGPFQRRFNIIFNFIYVILIAMPCMNTVMIMTIPDHWCFVPGRNLTNYTLDQWKQMTIPRDSSSSNFKQCVMFNVTTEDIVDTALLDKSHSDTLGTIDCPNGWEYDKTWYTLTIPSQVDWVCEQELRVSNVYAVARMADVIGTFFFGQLADTIGRRPVFFISLIFLLIGRITSGFVAEYYFWFLVVTFVGNLVVSPMFQSPLVISMEVSASDKRAQIAMLQCLGWTAGICLMPMIAWLTRDWLLFLLITTIPCAAFLFVYRWFPESPRWLANKGKPLKCMKVLEFISRVNGTKLPANTHSQLVKLALRTEQTFGIASLFSSWRLAKNSAIICVSWIVNSMSYYVLVLNATNMAGNPFLNFFWQSLAELPGYILGRLLSDRIGRRWTQSAVMFIIPFICFAMMFVIKDPNLAWLSTTLAVSIKFCNTITFYVVYLQALEIYPTCVRQTGTSCGAIIANAVGVLGPYVVYLGTAYDARYPYIVLGSLALLGGIVTAFLPETLHQKLPETLDDAQHFGENQSFWKFKYSPIADSSKSEE